VPPRILAAAGHVRGVTFSYAYFTPKHLGAGSAYLLTIADKDGRLLDIERITAQ
jgi:hypothetical protein